MARTPDVTATATTDVPAPRHATAWASLVYLVATFSLAYPALAGLFLINRNSDQYKAGYMFRDFAARSLQSGRGFPLWNPYLQGGLPYIGAMHGDTFYPTFLLRMILPTDLAMTWEFPIHLFLCGLFTYLFLRAWRFGFYSALIGGLAYMLSGPIAGTASPGHDGKLFVSAMLPIMLLVLTRGIRDGRRWAWGAAALVTGLAVLSPHPQALQYFLLVSGAFAVYVTFVPHPGFEPLARQAPAGKGTSFLATHGTSLVRLGLAGVSVIVGMLMGAVQFLPLLTEYMPWSPRAAGHTYTEAASYSYPIEETINWYWPQFSGILDSYWGRNGIHFHSDYLGALVLVLAGAAFGKTEQKGLRRFWVGIGIFSLLWAYGGNTPFFQIILAIIPGTKYFRAPSVIIFVTAFAVAVLAAMGVERIVTRRIGAKYAIGWAIAGGAIALLATAGGYTALVNAVGNAIASAYPPQAHDSIVAQIAERGTPNTAAAIFGAWRSFLFVLFGAGAVWAYATQRIDAKRTVITLAVLLSADLWSIERLYWIFSPRASVTFASDPAIDAIKKAAAAPGGLGRVIALQAGESLSSRDAAFYDGLAAHDLRIVEGYHGNQMDMYTRLLSLDSGRVNLTPEFWRHENVKYIYTGVDGATMARFDSSLKLNGHISQIAGPVHDAAGSMVYAYQLPMDNPTAWVATAMVKAPENQAAATVLDSRFDPTRVAIVDSGATNVQAAAIQSLPAAAPQRALVTSAPPGEYDISLDQPSTAGEALVVSDNYFPTWKATANGTPAVVARTNFNLIGVVLPPGTRTVQLRFTDPAYEKGKLITLAAIIIALVGLGIGLVLGRSRNEPTGLAA